MTTIVAGILFAVPVLALAAALVFVGRRLHGALDGESRDLRHLRSERQKLVASIRQDSTYPSLVEPRIEMLAVLDRRIEDSVKRSAGPVKESDYLISLRKGKAKVERDLAENIEGGYLVLADADRDTINRLSVEIRKAEKAMIKEAVR